MVGQTKFLCNFQQLIKNHSQRPFCIMKSHTPFSTWYYTCSHGWTARSITSNGFPMVFSIIFYAFPMCCSHAQEKPRAMGTRWSRHRQLGPSFWFCQAAKKMENLKVETLPLDQSMNSFPDNHLQPGIAQRPLAWPEIGGCAINLVHLWRDADNPFHQWNLLQTLNLRVVYKNYNHTLFIGHVKMRIMRIWLAVKEILQGDSLFN